MTYTIRNIFTPPTFEGDETKTRIAGTLYRILVVACIVTPLIAFFSITTEYNWYYLLAIILGNLIIAAILAILTRLGYVRLASVALMFSFLVLSTIIDIASNGEIRPASLLAISNIVTAGLLLGVPGLFGTIIILGIEHSLLLYLIHTGILTLTAAPAPTPAANGVITFVVYLMTAMLFSLMLRNTHLVLVRIRQSEQKLADSNQKLQKLTQDLEKRVKERTHELEVTSSINEKRAMQFEISARISNALVSTQNLSELLPRISEMISEQFGFYHIGVFLTEPNNQYVILSATNSEGGKKMLKRGYKQVIGERGLVGYVSQTGKTRIVHDVETDPSHVMDPELPLTRAQMSIPLKEGKNKKVVGVLDIQSTEANVFIDNNIEALSALAGQIGLAIQNAHLYDQTQKALAEFETIQRQYTRQTWRHLPEEEKINGYQYSAIGVIPLTDESEPAKVAENTRREVSVPIVLRGEKIGSLSVQLPTSEQVNSDQMDLIRAIAERVALSAENARLFDETTRRAERERVIAEITSKIGTSVRTESILRTTATELSHLLEDAEIYINLQATNKDNE
jgi:GAF domain-containing protein